MEESKESPIIIKWKEGSNGRMRKDHVCIHCNKQFPTGYQLKRHLMSHSGVRQYTCKVCGAAFVLSSSLYHHLKTHEGTRNHVCGECGQGFVRTSALAAHKKTHSLIKDHICKMCGKAFHQKGNLLAHMNAHQGIKPYSCTRCCKAFSQMSNLKTHMRSAHKIKDIFQCSLCEETFEMKKQLRNHEWRKHSSNRMDHSRNSKVQCNITPVSISSEVRCNITPVSIASVIAFPSQENKPIQNPYSCYEAGVKVFINQSNEFEPSDNHNYTKTPSDKEDMHDHTKIPSDKADIYVQHNTFKHNIDKSYTTGSVQSELGIGKQLSSRTVDINSGINTCNNGQTLSKLKLHQSAHVLNNLKLINSPNLSISGLLLDNPDSTQTQTIWHQLLPFTGPWEQFVRQHRNHPEKHSQQSAVAESESMPIPGNQTPNVESLKRLSSVTDIQSGTFWGKVPSEDFRVRLNSKQRLGNLKSSSLEGMSTPINSVIPCPERQNRISALDIKLHETNFHDHILPVGDTTDSEKLTILTSHGLQDSVSTIDSMASIDRGVERNDQSISTCNVLDSPMSKLQQHVTHTSNLTNEAISENISSSVSNNGESPRNGPPVPTENRLSMSCTNLTVALTSLIENTSRDEAGTTLSSCVLSEHLPTSFSIVESTRNSSPEDRSKFLSNRNKCAGQQNKQVDLPVEKQTSFLSLNTERFAQTNSKLAKPSSTKKRQNKRQLDTHINDSAQNSSQDFNSDLMCLTNVDTLLKNVTSQVYSAMGCNSKVRQRKQTKAKTEISATEKYGFISRTKLRSTKESSGIQITMYTPDTMKPKEIIVPKLKPVNEHQRKISKISDELGRCKKPADRVDGFVENVTKEGLYYAKWSNVAPNINHSESRENNTNHVSFMVQNNRKEKPGCPNNVTTS